MTELPLPRDVAERLAIAALGWLAADPDLIARFLAQAGVDPADLRRAAATPEFLAGVLDYILSEDDYVIGAAEAADCAPTDLLRARAALPGGDLPHWT